ncbi:sinapine esterase-like [Coffea eugenioides]|uniref:sinapine esterase-like n=1 Tax=Coffea eugenioides TaxID=49369 RepID=UPI000F5CA143|nr:sinapine esterase-like [Coffea arabica]XP_027161767.1 sinapine esterase-like [Coffea eugenioides]
MASSSSALPTTISFSVTFLILLSSLETASGCFTSIFAFGDSLADTGNYATIYPPIFHLSNGTLYCGLPPYGETYFHHPTGRCSDGRLIIDFIAEYYGLPPVPPYLMGAKHRSNSRFEAGLNFAVAGATALDVPFYGEKGISSTLANISMSTQLRWFKGLLPSLCYSSSCSEVFKSSLFLMGFGGNDYGKAFLQGKSLEETKSLVPLVISATRSAINELIDLGVVNIMVNGLLPDGCSPAMLTYFKSSNKEDYDTATGCLSWLNDFSNYHNELLQEELNRVRANHPDAFILYADYFNPLMHLFRSPEQNGFGGRSLMACCGDGGPPYNYNFTAQCGEPASTACARPSLYISWDGIHLTQAAYRFMAKGLLEGPFTTPTINTLCTSMKKDFGFASAMTSQL